MTEVDHLREPSSSPATFLHDGSSSVEYPQPSDLPSHHVQQQRPPPPRSPFTTNAPETSTPVCLPRSAATPLYTAVIPHKEMAAHEAADFKSVKGVYKNCRGIWAAQWTDERGQRHTKYFNPKYFCTEAEARHEAFRFKIHITREIEMRGGVQKRRVTPGAYREDPLLDTSYIRERQKRPSRRDPSKLGLQFLLDRESPSATSPQPASFLTLSTSCGVNTSFPGAAINNNNPFSNIGPAGTINNTGNLLDDFFLRQQLENNNRSMLPLELLSSNYDPSSFGNLSSTGQPSSAVADTQLNAAAQQLFFSHAVDNNDHLSPFRPADVFVGGEGKDDLLPQGTTLCGCGCGALAIAPARFACHHRWNDQEENILNSSEVERRASDSNSSLPGGSLFPPPPNERELFSCVATGAGQLQQTIENNNLPSLNSRTPYRRSSASTYATAGFPFSEGGGPAPWSANGASCNSSEVYSPYPMNAAAATAKDVSSSSEPDGVDECFFDTNKRPWQPQQQPSENLTCSVTAGVLPP